MHKLKVILATALLGASGLLAAAPEFRPGAITTINDKRGVTTVTAKLSDGIVLHAYPKGVSGFHVGQAVESNVRAVDGHALLVVTPEFN